ncbi:MacS family sensor histidine kinase [Nocardioides sp.]|uniref:MacS family sensor histidine kinase n=1 Tax=Nocardioides sp. TaxID=35761 RepID=UPI0035189466
MSDAAPGPRPSAADGTRAALAVEDRLFAALAVVRVVVVVYTVAVTAYRNNFDHPVAGWACIAAMVVASVVLPAVYASSHRRVPAVLLADLALALALLLLTPVVKGPGFAATIPGFWILCAMLAWAVRYGWRGGALAAAVLGAVDLLIRSRIEEKNFGNVFLLVLCGSMVGFVAESLTRMAAERDAAQRAAAAAAERARLARVVHDGVLQVLALVQRRGSELGGEAAALGRLAGEQEQALRTLIRTQASPRVPVPTAAGPEAGSLRAEADLAAELAALSTSTVQVGVPAGAVLLPAEVTAELTAVVAACLDNVRRHVGEHAPAWVLLDDLGDEVEVSVRDAGPGIAPGRLEDAERQGRLGVSESIRGRVRDLGGRASLDTGAHGTEWTFTVARGSVAHQ